jgi:hypothetical protein
MRAVTPNEAPKLNEKNWQVGKVRVLADAVYQLQQ